MARPIDPRPAPLGDELGDTIDAARGAAPERPEAADALDALDHPELLPVDRRHYVIDGEIAKGGMGRILAARDRRLGRAVAIKELLPRNLDATHRFELEARITARLQHPAIIHIYEAGVWPGGEAFYAMPRVRGRSLDKVVAEKRTLAERIGLLANVIAVVDALAYAHSQGIIHRDLKPANVLIGDFGETVVIDWGIAKDLLQPDAPAAAPLEGVVGTPAYMPPEQARGEPVDERADVYSLGALLYHVLVGEAPYRAPTAQRIVADVLAGPPPAISSRDLRLPADLVAVVERAMARDPDRRYRSAGDLAQDLKRFQTGQMVIAHDYTLGERVLRWVRRHRAIVAIATLAAVALVVVGAFGLRRVLAEKRTAEDRRAALLEERGRTELIDGHAGRALVYLQEAMAAGRSGGAIQFLVADALRPFDALVATMDAGGPVRDVACSPDGVHVAMAGESGVAVWRLDDQTLERRLPVGPTRVVRYDLPGDRLVTAGEDGVARVWDARSGELRHELAGHRGPILDVELSRDDRLLVTAGEDAAVVVWELASGRQLAAMREHAGPINAASFSPDGTQVVSASDDRTAIVWGHATGSVWPLRGHAGAVRSARFSPDGMRVVTASADHRAVVWDPETGKQLIVLAHRAAVMSIELHPDGDRVVTASADHTARLWELPPENPEVSFDAQPIATLEGHSDIVLDAVFDASGTRIATTGRDRSIRVWNAATGAPIVAFEGHGHRVRSVAFAPDGRVVSGSEDGTVKVWRRDEGTTTAIVDVGDDVHGLAASSDGRTIATGTSNGELVLWREPFDEPVSLGNRHTAPVTSIAFSADGALVVSGSEDGTATISRLDGSSPVRVETGAPVLAVAVAAGVVATAGDDGVLRFWGLADGRRIDELGGGATVRAIAFSPGGERLVAGDDAGRVVIWDVAARAPVGAPTIVADAVYAVGLDPAAARVVAGGDGDTPLLWAAAGGGAVVPVEGPTGVVVAVAFTPDGSRVITGGIDGVVGIWDTRNGRLLALRRGHTGPIVRQGLAVTAGGSTVVTASADRTIRIWDIRLDGRSQQELGELIEERVPWHLDSGDQARRITRSAGEGRP